MSVTLQQIADAAGVSRGTVDRALNDRGRINPKVAERIKKLAKEMGYQRNRAARALAMSQRVIKIGVIVQATNTPFIQNVLEGIEEAKREVEGFGGIVEIRKIDDIDSNALIVAMKELAVLGCQGIALMPSDDEHVAAMMKELIADGIHIVTFNMDLQNSGRICYVGQNSFQSGKTAGGLMAEILPKNSSMLVISGYPKNRSHTERATGFIEELKACRSDVRLLDIQYDNDSNQRAEEITREVLLACPNLSGIYLASAGVEGVCKALRVLDPGKKVRVVLNDMTQDSIQMLKNGEVRFLIDQNAKMQGTAPVEILFALLFDGKKPASEYFYTDIQIKTKNNVD